MAAQTEGASYFAHEAHLDIRSTKPVAHRILHPIQSFFDLAQVIGYLAINTPLQRCSRVTQPPNIHF